MGYTAICTYEGNLRTKMVHAATGQEVTTDAPKDNQGLGQAFSPTDLVASGLASCMLTIMGIESKKLEVDITGTTIKVLKTMASNPRRISALTVEVEMNSTEATVEQRAAIERAGVTCPVAMSLHPDIKVETRFEW